MVGACWTPVPIPVRFLSPPVVLPVLPWSQTSGLPLPPPGAPSHPQVHLLILRSTSFQPTSGSTTPTAPSSPPTLIYRQLLGALTLTKASFAKHLRRSSGAP